MRIPPTSRSSASRGLAYGSIKGFHTVEQTRRETPTIELLSKGRRTNIQTMTDWSVTRLVPFNASMCDDGE